MRVLLSMCGSHEDVERVAGLAVCSEASCAEAQVCAPPDFAWRRARGGVPPVATGAGR